MRKFLGSIVILAFVGFVIFLVREVRRLEPSGAPTYGITFSKPYAEAIGLDWRETYLALLDDLKVRRVRLPVYWNDVEREKDQFIFNDYDWMIEEAGRRRVELIIAVGQRLPRWPECHIPEWGRGLEAATLHEEIRAYLIETVSRYKGNPAIAAWQVENEPFLRFGECPRVNVAFLEQEIALVHGLDSRPVLLTDSGELSLWVPTARRADWFGTTMYRTVWSRWTGYITYPLPPGFFKVKRVLTRLITRPERMIVIELQAEPWTPKQPATRFPIEEQYKTMNPERFGHTIDYAKATSFDTFYLWGAEWWWWLKTKEHKPEIWEAARKLF
ncbi:MAG: hypothetical protein Q8R13_03135 [bacterium]|nr:hypothetical protein [bacterium]